MVRAPDTVRYTVHCAAFITATVLHFSVFQFFSDNICMHACRHAWTTQLLDI